MGARPIRPGIWVGTACHSETGAQSKLQHTLRPKQRLPNAPARWLNPPGAPPLVTSRGLGTPISWLTGRGRRGEGKRRGEYKLETPAQPPSLLPGCQRGPRPLSLPIRSGHRPALFPFLQSRVASALLCLVFLLCAAATRCQSSVFLSPPAPHPASEFSPLPRCLSPAVPESGCVQGWVGTRKLRCPLTGRVEGERKGWVFSCQSGMLGPEGTWRSIRPPHLNHL